MAVDLVGDVRPRPARPASSSAASAPPTTPSHAANHERGVRPTPTFAERGAVREAWKQRLMGHPDFDAAALAAGPGTAAAAAGRSDRLRHHGGPRVGGRAWGVAFAMWRRRGLGTALLTRCFAELRTRTAPRGARRGRRGRHPAAAPLRAAGMPRRAHVRAVRKDLSADAGGGRSVGARCGAACRACGIIESWTHPSTICAEWLHAPPAASRAFTGPPCRAPECDQPRACCWPRWRRDLAATALSAGDTLAFADGLRPWASHGE